MGMIVTDAERDATIRDIEENHEYCDHYREQLEAEGRSREEIKKLLDQSVTRRERMKDEVMGYRALREGILPLISSDQFQLAVIFCRIASGRTQEEFAQLRGVPLDQVQRDERNEYYGLPGREAERLVNLLGYHLNSVSRYEIVKK